MPAACAPAGSETGERQRRRRPGVADRRAAEDGQGPVGRNGVTRDLTDPVFTVNRNCPLWVISIQHGAVWLHRNDGTARMLLKAWPLTKS